jgi:hypothetical protein
MDAASSNWGQRVAASAVGALVIGIIAGLIGIGPERVVTAVLAATAAALGGALLDDLIESRSGARRVPATTGAVGHAGPVGEPATRAPGPAATRPTAPPLVSQATAADRAAPSARSATRSGRPDVTAPPPVTAPPARWFESRPPLLAEPSPRWSADGRQDLVAIYLAHADASDVACARCGRTVQRPAGDRPPDCPHADDPEPCVLEPDSDVQITTFRSRRDVSPGDLRARD